MRVLIAVHGYPPHYSGGAERRAKRTAQTLTELGHEVRVLTVGSFSDSGPAVIYEDEEQDGVLVRRMALGPLPPVADRFRQSYDNLAVGAVVAEMIDSWNPDVFHLFSGYLISASAVRIASERRVPIVVSLTDYWWLCHRITLLRTDGSRCDGPSPAGCARCHAESFRRYRVPARLWPRGANAIWASTGKSRQLGNRLGLPAQQLRAETLLPVLRQVDAMIAPSQFLADHYVRWGVDPQRIHVWRQGVALDRCVLRTPSDSLRVGYIGQVKSHKGVDLLVDAWSRLHGSRPRRLSIHGSAAGEDEYGARIQTSIDRLDDASWPGEFRGSEVWRILSELDVLVVPSRWVENSPNSILEAQAVGVPVVGTNLGGVAEMITHDRNGLLFEVDDAAGLAEQLQRLLDEPDLVERLRLNALPFQTVEDEIGRIERLYRRLIDRTGEPAVSTESIDVADEFLAGLSDGE